MPDKNSREERVLPMEITLPVSDTVPGPGTYHASILHLRDGEMPTVLGVERDNWIGAGTADDVVTSLKAPEPEKEPPLRQDHR